MKVKDAVVLLAQWDVQGRYVWLKRDLRRVFAEKESTFTDTLSRLVDAGILERPARNVYVYRLSRHIGAGTLDSIAMELRRGEWVYESLESALSAYGAISQIPVDRRTYMTTGRSGEYATPYGVIEFTHTDTSPSTFLARLRHVDGRPVLVASPALAWRDLKATRRNTGLVDEDTIKEITDDEQAE